MIGIQAQSTEFPDYMRRSDAADYLRTFYALPCRHSTLAKLACLGGGPPYRKAGKFPIYSREDLDAWARRRLGKLMRSTSELINQKTIAEDPRQREQSERLL
jgi:hypothetical protein